MILLLALAAPAHALTCEEVMNMVNVNVPTNIVIQTISESGEKYSADFVRCLTNEGAPAEVVAAAKQQMAQAAAPSEDSAPADDSGSGNKVKKKSDADREEFDKSEEMGPKSKKSKELTDASDDNEDTAKDPEALDEAVKQYNAKKPLTASAALFKMLQDGSFPDKEGKILYYLGRSFYDLAMYHSAQYYFIEVLKKGPSNPYFKYALPKLVSISKFTGDDSDLQRIVAKIPPEEYPRSARTQLYFLLGMKLYDQDKLTEAKKYFAQIPEKSDLYTRSKYMEGVINNKQGKLKSAVRSFSEVVRTKGEAQTQQELEDLDRLRDLSLMNIARIYYGIERFQDANTYYGYVPRNSSYWPQALFESAWTNFMLTDLNLTLGQILTVESPFYGQDEFIPEATVLKSLTYFNLCEYDDVERTLLEFESNFQPVHTEMKDVLTTYSSEEGKKLADQAYEKYFEGKGETTLPKSMFGRILRNQELAGIVNHLQVMDREEQLIATQKSQWKNSVGENLNKVLAEDRQRLKTRAGKLMLGEMATLTNYLGDLLGQAEIIRFEVVDARRADYTYKMQNQDLTDSSKGIQLDFATSSQFIYWPFNGEFWQDELGYYRYTEQAACK